MLKRVLLLSLAVINVPAAQMPPRENLATLEGLPTELKNIVIQNIGASPDGILNIPAIAQGLTSLAATSKKWHAVVNNPSNMLIILKSLPKAGAKLLAERLQKLLKTIPVMKSKEVDAWLKSFELEGGHELLVAVNAKYPDIHKIFKLLTHKNINVNAKNYLGETALMIASRHGEMGIVELLLAAGADVNAKDNVGGSALFGASVNGELKILKLLLSAGAEVNVKNNKNNTALMVVSDMGRTKIAELLLAAGANVDVKNSSGQTALMLASRAGHVDVVRLLLDNGANVNARSEHTFNMTALEFAQIQRAAHQNSERANVYNEIIKLLEAAEKAQKEKAARK
jgi:hypothetical protein